VTGRAPSSFGRPKPPPDDEFKLQGGQAIHLVVAADITPSEESMANLFTIVRDTTRAAVLAGYADAFAEMDADEPPDGAGAGGVAPGEPPPAG
jgi:hypothetical protein